MDIEVDSIDESQNKTYGEINHKEITIDDLEYDHKIFGHVFNGIKCLLNESNQETFNENIC